MKQSAGILQSARHVAPLICSLENRRDSGDKIMMSIPSTTQERPGHHRLATGPQSGAQATLCLHCSTGSSRQWRSLSTALGESHRVLAPDLLGYGDNPPWPSNRTLRLEMEVQRLAPLLASVAEPVDVVAHSFGAAVAVKLALTYPDKVRSLCLYEPVLFGLLERDVNAGTALSEIYVASSRVGRALADGDADAAARQFIDFWSGKGTWTSMPEPRRQSVAARIGKVRADFAALLADDTTLPALAQLEAPVLCLSGGRSPEATRRIADILAATFPRAKNHRFEEAGHMGPLTHPRQVNTRIEKFLQCPFTHSQERKAYTPLNARAA
jgi:pimeloyl-ACP methyl ester carboxylesterase